MLSSVIRSKILECLALEKDSFRVRIATPADASGILSCLRAAFADYQAGYTPDGFRDTVLTPETLQQRFSSMTIFTAEDGEGEIIGTIACQRVSEEEGHIRGMAVLPRWHGRGVAGELLRRVESELRANGCSRITLDTTEPLRRATRFYEKHGFQFSGKTSDFFGMPLYEYVKVLESTPSEESHGSSSD